MEPQGILTEKEAAAMIVDLKPQTPAKWRLRRKGPKYLKLGGKIRYRVIDIQEWMEASLVDPASQPPIKRKHVRRKHSQRKLAA
jgi:hypothetical protein